MSININKLSSSTLIKINGIQFVVGGGTGDQKCVINEATGQKAYLINTPRRKHMGTYRAVAGAGDLKGDIDLFIGHAAKINAVTGEAIEIKAKPQRTRQISRAKTVTLDDLPSARDAKAVAQYVKIIRQYRSQQIDAKTMVESLSKDVWQMLRELKEAGHHDPYEILNREDFKKTVDRYGAADSVKFLERLEGYIYGQVSEYNADLPKSKRLTFRDV
jgi:hypothetical protein